MTDFQQQALLLAAQQHAPVWLNELRQQGAQTWQSTVWPTRKTEHWKYTSLVSLQKDNFANWAHPANDWKTVLN